MSDKRKEGDRDTGKTEQNGVPVFEIDYMYIDDSTYFDDGRIIEYLSRIKLPHRPAIGDVLWVNADFRFVEASPTQHDLYDFRGEGPWTVVKIEQYLGSSGPKFTAHVKPGDLTETLGWIREIQRVEGEHGEEHPGRGPKGRRRDEKYYMEVLKRTLGKDELYQILRKVIEEYGKTRGGMDNTKEYLEADDPRWKTGFRSRRVNVWFDGGDVVLSIYTGEDGPDLTCTVTGLEVRKSGENMSVADFVAAVREEEGIGPY